MRYLIVDCQIFQTNTFYRGMGRLSLGLLRALHQYAPDTLNDYKIIGIHNTEGSESSSTWQDQLKRYMPGILFQELPFAGPRDNDVKQGLDINRQLIASYLTDTTAKSDEVLFFSPSLLDDTVYACLPDTTKAELNHIKTIAIFYDLIPFLFWQRYLTSLDQKANYFYRLADVFKADVVICDSATTLNDLHRFLFVPRERLYVIHCGDPNFNEDASIKDHSSTFTKSLEAQKFILSVSGDDLRKNNERMVAGFEKFNRLHNNEYKLIITSSFSEETQFKLNEISGSIVFSQKIPNEDLDWLYRNAKCLLFVPEYEGLGLPVLEAAKYELPVVASNIEVFREITTDGVTFVDEMQATSIASGLNEVIDKGWSPRKKELDRILKLWSWSTAAKEFGDILEKISFSHKQKRLPNIAIVCPDPRGISSIGKFVQEQHAEIISKAQVTYYLEKSPTLEEERIAYLPYVAKCLTIDEFIRDQDKSKFDQIIYHIGNSDYHLYTLRAALTTPGTTILHDTNISGLAGLMRAHKIWDRARYETELKITEKLNEFGSDLSFSGSLISSSDRIIVHSTYALEAVTSALVKMEKKKTVLKLEHPMTLPDTVIKRVDKSVLDIGLAGIINMAKGLDVLELLFKKDNISNRIMCHMFGYSYASNIVELVSLYRLGPIVLETDLPDLGFQNKIREMDLLLNYRPIYHGETSRATLEAMRYGVVPIVRNVGWFSELPDDTAIKVNSPQEIPSAIEALLENKELLLKMSDNCREFIKRNCSVKKYIEAAIHAS